MPQARIVKRDEFGEIIKTFPNSAPYESLKPGDIVEVEDIHGTLRDYVVVKMYWDFTHFGDKLEIEIEAINQAQKGPEWFGDIIN